MLYHGIIEGGKKTHQFFFIDQVFHIMTLWLAYNFRAWNMCISQFVWLWGFSNSLLLLLGATDFVRVSGHVYTLYKYK